MVTAVIVANNFIKKSLDEKINLTPLKLQKLIYFLYKEYLKSTNNELFTERFETWKYGPVVPSVYTEFSCFGSNTITRYASDSKGSSYIVREEDDFKSCINKVWSTYKTYSGKELSDLTHRENTAWSKACERKEPFLNKEEIFNEESLY